MYHRLHASVMAAERRRPMRSGLHLVGAFLAGSLVVTVLLLGLPQQGGRQGACWK